MKAMNSISTASMLLRLPKVYDSSIEGCRESTSAQVVHKLERMYAIKT